jgi:SAM-dependent methyltransferase
MAKSILTRRLAALTDPQQFRLVPRGDGAVLDLGCGRSKFPGAVGLDISADTDADIVADLDEFPYPIESDCQDVIEHVASPLRTMAELHRIGRPGARVLIRTPHFSSVLAYSDPTHHHYFSTAAVRGLAVPSFEHYTAARFEVVELKLDFWAPYRLLGVAALANRHLDLYERYFAYRFPAMNIRAALEVEK